jgi:hypothetical protein
VTTASTTQSQPLDSRTVTVGIANRTVNTRNSSSAPHQVKLRRAMGTTANIDCAAV